MQEHYYT